VKEGKYDFVFMYEKRTMKPVERREEGRGMREKDRGSESN
jgi:hypothetical protein